MNNIKQFPKHTKIVISLALIALIFIAIDGVSYFVHFKISDDHILKPYFKIPTANIFTVYSIVIYLIDAAVCVMWLIYLVKYKFNNKGITILRSIFLYWAIAHIFDMVQMIIRGSTISHNVLEYLFDSLFGVVFFIIAISDFHSTVSKAITITAISLRIILQIISMVFNLYLSISIYFAIYDDYRIKIWRVAVDVIPIISMVALYISILIFIIYNKKSFPSFIKRKFMKNNIVNNDPKSALLELNEMKSIGAITDEEYEQRRKIIISNL